jgi:L-fuculose-phosphate aldolase
MAELRDETRARRELAEVGRLLYERDLLAARDGNLSVWLGPGRILTTPAGVCKGRLAPEDFVLVDGRGVPLAPGARPASTEIKMHLAVYPVRPEVRAIVHTHPPAATAFAVAGVPIDKAALAEVVYNLGVVPLTEYALPSTEELARIIGHYVRYYQALLLANHGVLAVGADLWEAFDRLEGVEHFARILLYARQLGGPKELSREQISELCELRRKAGVTSPNPLCDPPAPERQTTAQGHAGPLAPRALVESVAREVVAQLRDRIAGSMGRAAR